MSETFRRITRRMLALGIYAVLLAGAFWAGFELGQERVSAALSAEVAAQVRRCDDCAAQRDAVRDEIASLYQQRTVLERTQQIDREANRSLADQLKRAQDEHLSLSKENAYLKRLVQDGGKGVVRVNDLRLSKADRPGDYHYAFTITQLVPSFGVSKGRVEISIEGQKEGAPARLGLSELPVAKPNRVEMDFEHFQTIQGTFALPEGFEPQGLVVEIKPENEQLLQTTESFPWTPEAP